MASGLNAKAALDSEITLTLAAAAGVVTGRVVEPLAHPIEGGTQAALAVGVSPPPHAPLYLLHGVLLI